MMQPTNRNLHQQAIPSKLVDLDRIMKIVWDDESRPSKRFFLELKAQGKVPAYKIGRRVFYRPDEVERALMGMRANRKN